jgi:hypothetical protein
MKKSFLTVMILFLIVVGSVGCGETQHTPTTIPDKIATGAAKTKAIAATLTAEIPISTQTPIRTLTPTSVQGLGAIKGKLIGKNTQQPIMGTTVILCGVIPEDNEKCQVLPDIKSISQNDGSFSLENVPINTYAIVYATSKNVDTKSWKGIILNYPIAGKGSTLISYPSGVLIVDNVDFSLVEDPFGGDKGISIIGRIDNIINVHVLNQFVGFIMIEGSLTSNKFGLTLEFVDSHPIVIKVEDNKATEIMVYVSGK